MYIVSWIPSARTIILFKKRGTNCALFSRFAQHSNKSTLKVHMGIETIIVDRGRHMMSNKHVIWHPAETVGEFEYISKLVYVFFYLFFLFVFCFVFLLQT